MATVPVDGSTLAILLFVAFSAGLVDAIVGGGGLIQLPALLIALPHQAPATILGTHKFVSMFGTSIAAVNYGRRFPPKVAFALPMVAGAGAGAVLGASLATLIPADDFKPIILVVLVAVWLYTWRQKKLGEVEQGHPTGTRAYVLGISGGSVIGFYDGLIGPGTGSFLIFLLVHWVGMSFLRASATAKLVNVVTNIAAFSLFAATGHVLFALGAAMAVANLVGGAIGSHLAIKKGSGFVRVVFLVTVAALIVKLATDLL
jgi:uncharacterized membrane protein YfcA